MAGIAALVARTGYTGEDGFEIFVENGRAGELWDALLEAGRRTGLVPVGLGARDTLRLEAGMPLYGNELDPDHDPYEAGLGRVVKLDKPGDFVGRAALERIAAEGPRRLLVGLVVRGRGIARHGYPVFAGERRDRRRHERRPSRRRSACRSPWPTSRPATPSPVRCSTSRSATQRVPAEVVPLPFYRRAG